MREVWQEVRLIVTGLLPAADPPPELAIAQSALLRPEEATHILMADNKKAGAISFRDSPCLHLSRSSNAFWFADTTTVS